MSFSAKMLYLVLIRKLQICGQHILLVQIAKIAISANKDPFCASSLHADNIKVMHLVMFSGTSLKCTASKLTSELQGDRWFSSGLVF